MNVVSFIYLCFIPYRTDDPYCQNITILLLQHRDNQMLRVLDKVI